MLHIKNAYFNIPLIKLIIVFILGISLGIYNSSSLLLAVSLGIILSSILVKSILILNSSISIYNRFFYLSNRLIFLSFIALGYISSYSFHQEEYSKHYSNYIGNEKTNYFKVKLLESPIEKDNSFKLEAYILESKKKGVLYKTLGKTILYFEKDSLISKTKKGDILYLKGKLNKIQSAKNPNEFDFKKYLSYKNIQYQSYLNAQSWKIASLGTNKLDNLLYRVKTKLQEIINRYIYETDERAVASALLLGNRNYLTDNILNAFSSSGATHILAVSGLHVGIFYGIISFSLSWLLRFKKIKILHPILTLLAIWFYVGLTGASPSVVRAATMFSLFAIGLSISQYINIFNVIAFSAFIIICYNPFIVTEVGFQLSYFAVIGIIYLQAKIYKLLYIKNYVGDKIWLITSVSIAAQISTFPLIVLYFHQFPNLFWISNLIVIPAASIILYGGILMFLFSWNEFILSWIGKILSFFIYWLNQSLILIEKIPFALSSKLYISHLQALLFYVIIILIVFAIENRSKLLFKYSLLTLFILAFTFSHKYFKIQTQKQLIVYHVPKISAIEIIDHQTSYSQFDSSLLNKEKLLIFRVKHNWWEKQIRNQEFNFNALDIKKNGSLHLLSYNNKRIVLLGKGYKTSNTLIVADYAIISHSPKIYMNDLSSSIKADTYIFDTSNEKWKQKYWKQDCENLGINCYFVSDTTAFEIDL